MYLCMSILSMYAYKILSISIRSFFTKSIQIQTKYTFKLLQYSPICVVCESINICTHIYVYTAITFWSLFHYYIYVCANALRECEGCEQLWIKSKIKFRIISLLNLFSVIEIFEFSLCVLTKVCIAAEYLSFICKCVNVWMN